MHPGFVEWTIQAFRNYLTAWQAHRESTDTPAVIPVRPEWVVHRKLEERDSRGVLIYEWTSWGRRYRSADGSVREAWLIQLNEPKDRSAAEKTEIAHVAAHGTPLGAAERTPAETVQPQLVKVVAFGTGSAKAKPLGEWHVSATPELFREHVVKRAMAVMDDTKRRPGSNCAECKITVTCESLKKFDFLPAVAARPRGRRTLSVTDLRMYDACPARYHLDRQLGLGVRDMAESPEIVRGRAVDAWLNQKHDGESVRCDADDMLALSFPELQPDQSEQVTRMLAEHTAFCPMSETADLPPRVQPQLSAYDERLGVVFVATPDLLFRRDGAWVWRETKTAGRPIWRGRPLLRQFPQLAMGTLLLAAGVVGDLSRASRVELEHLRADGGQLEEVDPNQPEVLAEAREVIGDLTRPLLFDDRFEAKPGTGCGGCPVLGWCSPGRAHLARAAEAEVSGELG